MFKRNIEYNANSLTVSGGADLNGKNTNDVRKEVANYWDENSDLVEIVRSEPGLPVVGYIGFNRRTNLYFWLTPDKSCRAFDPVTGKLGKKMAIPSGTMKTINSHKKKVAARKLRRKW